MSKYSNTIEYNLKTTIDNSGLIEFRNDLIQAQRQLEKLARKELISPDALSRAQNQINGLERALSSSFNGRLGMLDMNNFRKAIETNKVKISELSSAFNTAGIAGQTAFNSFIGSVGKMDVAMNAVSRTTDKVMNTVGNTLRWGVVASGFSQMMNSVHAASQYVKDLDSSLTNIMMVTDYSREAMSDYAKSANEAAKAIGSTTVAMTDATLVFAQQGTGNFWSNR